MTTSDIEPVTDQVTGATYTPVSGRTTVGWRISRPGQPDLYATLAPFSDSGENDPTRPGPTVFLHMGYTGDPGTDRAMYCSIVTPEVIALPGGSGDPLDDIAALRTAIVLIENRISVTDTDYHDWQLIADQYRWAIRIAARGDITEPDALRQFRNLAFGARLYVNLCDPNRRTR